MASAPGPGDPTRLAGARCPLRSWGSRGLGASRASTRAQVPPAQPAPASRDRAAPPCQHHPAQPSWSRRSCRSHQPAELLEDEVKTEVKQVCSCGQASRSRAQSRVCRALFSPFPLKGPRLLTSGTQTVAGRGDRAEALTTSRSSVWAAGLLGACWSPSPWLQQPPGSPVTLQLPTAPSSDLSGAHACGSAPRC